MQIKGHDLSAMSIMEYKRDSALPTEPTQLEQEETKVSFKEDKKPGCEH